MTELLKKEWTHKSMTFSDIRELTDFYIFTINKIDTPLIVKKKIFEDRIRQYFFKSNVSRDDILSVKWNLYITKGFYVKYDKEQQELTQYHQDSTKNYVSFLEIDGPLSQFKDIIK